MDFARYLAVFHFLRDGNFPQGADATTAKQIRNLSRRYVVRDDKLHLRKYPDIEILHEENVEPTVRRVHEEGHFGNNNTWKRVRLQYEAYQLMDVVRRVVRECEICQRRKRRLAKRTNPHHPIPTPSRPFYMIGVDAVGPVTVSVTGNRYILVGVDYLTRWPVAMAVPDITAQTTADFLLRCVVTHYGVPNYILTDQGSNFTSEYVRRFLEDIGCRHLTTTAYRPQTNGLCERMNQTIVQTITKLVAQQGEERRWDEQLDSALLAIRTMPNDTTSLSPAMLLYGYELRTPAIWRPPESDFVVGDLVGEIEIRTQYITDAVSKYRHQAQVATQTRQARSKKRYDSAVVTPPVIYQLGDVVLMRDQTPVGKFADKWLGPMKVVRVNALGTYHLEGPGGRRIDRAVNGDNLRPWESRTQLVPDVVSQRAAEQFQAFLDRRPEETPRISTSSVYYH
jgi:hypothetical protein